jgi:Asp-tRNA(Asn)/Glu-tRNA(Gln) amidotransferase B subunit
MPAARRARVAEASGLPADSDGVVTVVRLDLDGLVMAAAVVGADAALAVRRLVNEAAAAVDQARHLDPDAFGRLLLMESKGELTTAQAREVLRHLLAEGGDPASIAKQLGFESLSGDDTATVIDEVIAANAAEWDRFLHGEDKLQGLFIGKIKAATQGKADLKAVAALLRERKAAGQPASAPTGS